MVGEGVNALGLEKAVVWEGKLLLDEKASTVKKTL